MIIIACVEDRWGMAFNGRRLSMDEEVRKKILKLTAGRRLWMEEYSRKQFEKMEELPETDIRTENDPEKKAGKGEFCFMERTNPAPFREKTEGVILFRWNRTYPADVFFDPEILKDYRLKYAEEFAGSSHEKITLEVYEK